MTGSKGHRLPEHVPSRSEPHLCITVEEKVMADRTEPRRRRSGDTYGHESGSCHRRVQGRSGRVWDLGHESMVRRK
jgi:hypothetical protein